MTLTVRDVTNIFNFSSNTSILKNPLQLSDTTQTSSLAKNNLANVNYTQNLNKNQRKNYKHYLNASKNLSRDNYLGVWTKAIKYNDTKVIEECKKFSRNPIQPKKEISIADKIKSIPELVKGCHSAKLSSTLADVFKDTKGLTLMQSIELTCYAEQHQLADLKLLLTFADFEILSDHTISITFDEHNNTEDFRIESFIDAITTKNLWHHPKIIFYFHSKGRPFSDELIQILNSAVIPLNIIIDGNDEVNFESLINKIHTIKHLGVIYKFKNNLNTLSQLIKSNHLLGSLTLILKNFTENPEKISAEVKYLNTVNLARKHPLTLNIFDDLGNVFKA
jgi:hypothetical protein